MEVKNTYSWQKKFTDIHENLLQSPWCKQESNIPCISCVGYLNILIDVLLLFVVVLNTIVWLSAINNGLFCDWFNYFVDECWDCFDFFCRSLDDCLSYYTSFCWWSPENIYLTFLVNATQYVRKGFCRNSTNPFTSSIDFKRTSKPLFTSMNYFMMSSHFDSGFKFTWIHILPV